ncbi:MAG: threonine ammonia-lyase IlvA [Propionibacteriaceae bacterium]|nr:threonine ammonia-lyase IlvA [Propionibacteriaceae bacterium]
MSDFLAPAPSLAEIAGTVDAAAATLRGVMEPTPLQFDARLSQMTGARVLLKREDLSDVRSYKLRGAYVLMSALSADERAAGVICASAGNHAQGVAFACKALGIDGEIVVPTTTPRQKRDRILALGEPYVHLIVAGETYDASSVIARERAAEQGRTLVPAFDHLSVVAGQGTVAREVVAQLGGKAPDVMILPVGGGGLLVGCGAWLEVHCPGTRLVGVEPAGAACVIAGLEQGGPVSLNKIDTFVDGAAVGRAGDVTLPLIMELPIEMMVVSEGQVCSEMLALYQSDGIISEPAGALASSVLRAGPHDVTLGVSEGQTVVCVLSGGNNDISRYSEVIERSLVHEGRKHYLLVSFPQEPGALRRFLDEVLGPNDDIVLFEYTKKSNREQGPALVGIELGNAADYPALMDRLESSPVTAERVDPTSTLYRYLV